MVLLLGSGQGFARQGSDGRKWRSPGLLQAQGGGFRRSAEGATWVRR